MFYLNHGAKAIKKDRFPFNKSFCGLTFALLLSKIVVVTCIDTYAINNHYYVDSSCYFVMSGLLGNYHGFSTYSQCLGIGIGRYMFGGNAL